VGQLTKAQAVSRRRWRSRDRQVRFSSVLHRRVYQRTAGIYCRTGPRSRGAQTPDGSAHDK
jgi:hypothetical protein